MLKILIVEDQFFARLALRTVIDSRDDMRCVAETAKGAEAITLFRATRPDVVIMDLKLPDLSGFLSIRQIRAEDPDARIVVLSNYDGSEDVYRALNEGALAYLTKDASDDDLVEAILTVHRGQRFLPQNIATLLRERFPSDELTDREGAVLRLLAEGFSNQEIADRLGIAEKTVRSHMGRVFDKLCVEDRTQAVLAAIRRGLVHLK